jgi:hypothetical protein
LAGTLVKIVGGNLAGNDIENAASEYTLKELLKTMNTMNKTGPNSKKAAAAQEDNTKKVKDNTKATEELSDAKRTLATDLRWLSSRGFRLLGQGISSVTTGLIGVGSDILKFSTSMLDAQLDVTDFSSALADSKLNVLGIGTAFNGVVKFLNANYTTFQSLSTSGILLNGSIVELQQEAASQRLELSQLNSILSQNSERLALLGTATDGARLAMRLGARAYKQNAEELRAWGVNFEEQGELFTSFLGINALALRRRTMSEDDLVNQSASYVKNLRQLSSLTGKSVDELNKEMEKQNFSAAFDSFVAGITDTDEQQRIRNMVAEMGATYGEAGAELAMAQAMNLPPITEAAQSMAAVLPQLNDEIGNQVAMARRFNGSTDEFMTVVRQRNNELANSMQGWIQENSALAQVLSLNGDVIGPAFQSIIRGLNIYAGDITKLNERLDLDDDPTANMLKAINEALGGLREAATRLTTDFFNKPEVRKAFNDFADFISTFDIEKYNPFNEEGRKNIGKSFNTLMENFGSIIKSFWEGPNAVALRDTISSLFKTIVEEIILAIEGILPTFGAARRIREERALSDITPEDRTTALTSDEETLTENQQVYRGLIDEAVNLQTAINRIDPSTAASDPYAATMLQTLQSEFDQLIERLPEGSESDINTKALLNEFQRQQELSQNAWFQSSREAAGIEAERLSQQLLTLGVEPNITETRKIGTLRATGMKEEPKDTTALIHAGERVLNPQETQEYNSQSGSQRTVVEKLDQLNNTMMAVASLMSQELAIQTRTMNNISGLGSDLMKGMP